MQEALVEATRILKKIALPHSAFEAEILLSHVLGKSREYLLAHPDTRLKTAQQKIFLALLRRREKGEPLAYLTKTQVFCGLEFCINAHVLIPRPETELLVDWAQEKIRRLAPKPVLADLGTGSGCIGITLAKLFPSLKIYAVDISPAALRLARRNARKHHVANIKFRPGNLLAALPPVFWKNQSAKIILANLPYLSNQVYQNFQVSLKYEPRQALWGGWDGLQYYRQLFPQLKKFWQPEGAPLFIVLEINPEQTSKIRKLILASFPNAKITIKKDLAGLNRFVIIKLT